MNLEMIYGDCKRYYVLFNPEQSNVSVYIKDSVVDAYCYDLLFFIHHFKL